MTRFALLANALVLLVTACASDDRSLSATDPVQDIVLEGDPYYMSATDKAYYQSLEEMYRAAEIVVVGEVVKVEPG